MAKIMIVDDSMFMRLTLKTLLISCGHQVVGEAMDSTSAVELYKKIRPDLVTMDIIMPAESGLEAVRKIVQLDPAAKVLMISAMGQDLVFQQAMACGAKGFLYKPVKAEELKAKIRSILPGA